MGLFGPSKKSKSKRYDDLMRIVFHGQVPPGNLSEESLLSIANAQARDGLRIMQDCVEILKATHDKSTFYYRLKLFETTTEHMAQLEPYVKFSGAKPSDCLKTWEQDKQELIRDFESRPGVSYYSNMEKVDAQWSVLSNLKIFTGEKADQFESTCFQNIQEYHDMVSYNMRTSEGYERPQRVPAYVRLAMLYEKQGKYDRAVEVCAAAIKAGAVNDGSKGKMYGRLARMIRKSGIEVTPEVQALMIEK